MRGVTSALLLLSLAGGALAACPPGGDAIDSMGVELNRLKNRETKPDHVLVQGSLSKVLQLGDDYLRWSSDVGVVIEAVVVGVRSGPVESCNCHATADSLRDTHIELAMDVGERRGWRLMVAEVTPRWRSVLRTRGEDWSTEGLRVRLLGRRVRVTGWMLFDLEHAGDSRNTAPRGRGNSRATAWEIHPVTAIELLN